MDIHYSENNLGDMDNSINNDELLQNNSNENNKEMNPYADKKEGIHDTICNDNDETNKIISQSNNPNININLLRAMYLKAYQNKIKQNQMIINRRNDIMRSVAKERFKSFNKPMSKQIIKAGISKNKYKYRSTQSLLNKKKENLTSVSQTNNDTLKRNSEIHPSANFPIPVITNKSFNGSLRNDPPIPTAFVGPWIQDKDIMSGLKLTRANLTNANEKPKEVNLAEILTSVLQDVVSGKIKSIENAIGKLRVNYEEKNVFSNVNKRDVILLNFEDDTTRPVLKIDETYMSIIEDWYKNCDLLMDIEETNISIPENITVQDVSNVLFQDINCKYKDEYLNNYIPLVINNIISKNTTKDLEKKYFIKTTTDSISEYPLSSLENINVNENITNIKLKNIGVVVPDNFDESSKKTECHNDSSNSVFQSKPWYLNEIGTFDPEIMSKYILDSNVRKNKNTHSFNEHKVAEQTSKPSQIYCYNEVFDINPFLEDENNNIIPTSYTNSYNCLNPKFSDNSCLLDEVLVGKKTTDKKLESICVLINDKFLQTLTIKNPDKNVNHIVKHHPEFGFIKLFDYETNNVDIINFIEREFDKTSFDDVEELNKKLLVVSQYVDFSNKQNDIKTITTSEECQVKAFLLDKYHITDDINNKMKASILNDIIINSNVVKIDKDKISGFRNRLSKYLKDLGLQKKRYNDGFYYYGIVEKISKMPHGSFDKRLVIDLDEILKKRDEERESFFA